MAGAAGGRLMAVFAMAIAVLLKVATRMGEHTPALSVRRCVSPDAPLAWLGVHLRVLSESPGCGAGRLAWHPGSGHSAELVLMVAVPTLLANLGVVLGAVGVWATLRALPARAAAVFVRLCRRRPGAGPVLPALRPFGTGRWPAVRSLRAWQLDRSPVRRRGPPMSEATR